MPYQLVGDVAISRGKNPYLNDQANREGLESNRFYYLFHDILTFVVEKFEEDRQYPLKLYGDLTRKIKKEVVERHKQEVLANIVEHLDANKGKKRMKMLLKKIMKMKITPKAMLKIMKKMKMSKRH